MTNLTMSDPSGRELRSAKHKMAAIVAAAILGGLGVLLIFVYLTYRGAPVHGEPGHLDHAEGVRPQYPPATPAEPSRGP